MTSSAIQWLVAEGSCFSLGQLHWYLSSLTALYFNYYTKKAFDSHISWLPLSFLHFILEWFQFSVSLNNRWLVGLDQSISPFIHGSWVRNSSSSRLIILRLVPCQWLWTVNLFKTFHQFYSLPTFCSGSCNQLFKHSLKEERTLPSQFLW